MAFPLGFQGVGQPNQREAQYLADTAQLQGHVAMEVDRNRRVTRIRYQMHPNGITGCLVADRYIHPDSSSGKSSFMYITLPFIYRLDDSSENSRMSTSTDYHNMNIDALPHQTVSQVVLDETNPFIRRRQQLAQQGQNVENSVLNSLVLMGVDNMNQPQAVNRFIARYNNCLVDFEAL